MAKLHHRETFNWSSPTKCAACVARNNVLIAVAHSSEVVADSRSRQTLSFNDPISLAGKGKCERWLHGFNCRTVRTDNNMLDMGQKTFLR